MDHNTREKLIGGTFLLLVGLAPHALFAYGVFTDSHWWMDAAGNLITFLAFVSVGTIIIWPFMGLFLVLRGLWELFDAAMAKRSARKTTP